MRAPLVARLFHKALSGFFADNVPRLGAALAYYTLFALAPVLLVAIAIAGWVFGEEAVRGQIVGQIDQLVGTQGAETVEGLLRSARSSGDGVFASIVGGVTFLVAATGAFLELQGALNKIWKVHPKPGFDIRRFLLNRAQSFGLVIVIGFLLLVSLAVSAALSALFDYMRGGSEKTTMVLYGLNLLISLIVIAALFAVLFRVLPDVKLRWRDVAVGGLITAVLFTIGKQLIGLYLGRSTTASAYGAAGSVVVLLIWVYYTSQIVLFGAELTRVYTEHVRGREHERMPAPMEHAARGRAKHRKEL